MAQALNLADNRFVAKKTAEQLKREIYIGIGYYVAILIPVAVIGPIFFTSQGKDHRGAVLRWANNSNLMRGSAALEAGDTRRAKAYSQAVLQFAGTDNGAQLLMADALQAEGKSARAYAIYHRLVYPNQTSSNDDEHLLRFGAVAEAVGKPKEALVAYRRVINNFSFYVDKGVVNPYLDGQPELADARAVANMMPAVLYKRKGYLLALSKALHQFPNDPCLHYLHAYILSSFRHWGEAKEEIDRAASELSPEAGARLQSAAGSRFGFDRLDHGSRGVIDKNGKFTVTRYKMALPNRDVPIQEGR